MGATKTDQYTDRQLRLATITKALGHPARIAIVEYLLKVDSCICGDIVNELPLAQATVSQHLRELKAANLIKGEIEGTAICYCLNQETWSLLTEELQLIFKSLQAKNNGACC
jgi:ArsR family transcriptional regulator